MPTRRKIEQITESFASPRDGLSLRLYQATVRDPVANVVIVHGFSDHAGRYEHVMEAFCKAAFNVYRLDLRGHGKSEGVKGRINHFSEYLDDLEGAIRHWKAAQDGDRPWFLLGHSMGGLIGARFMEERGAHFRGCVLSSPFLGLRTRVPLWQKALAAAASYVAPGLTLPSGIDPAVLTHDKVVVEAYREDPMTFSTANARWFISILSAQKETLKQASRIDKPMLVLQAADDMLVDPEATRLFAKSLTVKDATFHVMDDCYHELLNELIKDRIIRDIIQWIEQRSAEPAAT